MEDFLHMGGYALYVWSAYGLTALVFAWNLWSARRLHTQARAQARRRMQAAPQGSAPAQTETR